MTITTLTSTTPLSRSTRNTGTTQIIQKTHQQWSESKPREDLTYKEMERLISLSAYNDEGNHPPPPL